jgi:hypothetical protein
VVTTNASLYTEAKKVSSIMKFTAQIYPVPFHTCETIDLCLDKAVPEIRFQYIRISQAELEKPLLNLKIDTEGSPFKQVMTLDKFLFAGFGSQFIVFDLEHLKLISQMEFGGYFGSFSMDKEDIFIATDSEMYKLNLAGELIWKAGNLGIDGVILHNLAPDEIHGSGEWDPPGGWEDFILDRESGKKK